MENQIDWIAEDVISMSEYRAGHVQSERESEDAVIQQAMAILERRLSSRRESDEKLESPAEVKQYLSLRLAYRRDEHFMMLFLDTRHRVIAMEELFHGTVDGCSVHPRVCVRRALELNAAAVVLAHNHPSGVSSPSRADKLITQTLKEALSVVGVRVLDHLVIAEDIYSFAEHGLI